MNLKLICLIIVIINCATLSLNAVSGPVQLEYYPIIFVHGHSSSDSVENTWDWMIENKLDNQGFTNYGHIWADTVLPTKLSPRTMFSAGFYRRKDGDSFNSRIGKIGAIPLLRSEAPSMIGDELTVYIDINNFPAIFKWKTTPKEYGSDYFDPNRESYAARLKEMVDHVMYATNSKKVILVTHSMGGLVARAYIKWLGGDKTVYKLLTVGAPNHGIAEDGRAAMEQFGNSSTWQFGGEYLEMSTRTNFKGRSYTYWLNDGWSTLCQQSGLQYATVAGNYNPWPAPIKIGHDSDGVIDSNSVQLEGAVFNAKSQTAHAKKLGFATVSFERSISHSTYTAEIIKRWIFYNQVDRLERSDVLEKSTINFPSVFGNWTTAQVETIPTSRNAVCINIAVYNQAGNEVSYCGWPAYPILNHRALNLSQGSSGVYITKIDVLDMDGTVYSGSTKMVKNPGSIDYGEWGNSAILILDKYPNKISTNNYTVFKFRSNKNEFGSYDYQLDDQPTSSLIPNTSPIQINQLTPGIHKIYIRGYSGIGGPKMNNFVEYAWMVADSPDLAITNQTIIGQKGYNAAKSINVSNTTFKVTSAVTLVAGNAIDLNPDTTIEEGASCNIEVVENSNLSTAFVSGPYVMMAQDTTTDSAKTTAAIVPKVVNPEFEMDHVVNSPNPFNPDLEGTQLEYNLTSPADMTIHIYSLGGELQKSYHFLSTEKGGLAGFNTVPWDGRNQFGEVVSNGVYIAYVIAKADGKIKKGKVKLWVRK